jgi:hypothetical protein
VCYNIWLYIKSRRSLTSDSCISNFVILPNYCSWYSSESTSATEVRNTAADTAVRLDETAFCKCCIMVTGLSPGVSGVHVNSQFEFAFEISKQKMLA